MEEDGRKSNQVMGLGRGRSCLGAKTVSTPPQSPTGTGLLAKSFSDLGKPSQAPSNNSLPNSSEQPSANLHCVSYSPSGSVEGRGDGDWGGSWGVLAKKVEKESLDVKSAAARLCLDVRSVNPTGGLSPAESVSEVPSGFVNEDLGEGWAEKKAPSRPSAKKLVELDEEEADEDFGDEEDDLDDMGVISGRGIFVSRQGSRIAPNP